MLARGAGKDKEVSEAEHIYEAAQAVLERLVREAYAAGCRSCAPQCARSTRADPRWQGSDTRG
jgi:hypothetical protein